MTNNTIKILLVDDEPDLLELCTDTFEMEGYQVIPFTCVLKAIEYLKSNEVNLVVSDSLMPEMNGVEFFEEIQFIGHMRGKPFVLSTGQIDLDDKALLGIGISKILIKPFDISDLLDEATRLTQKA